jgi:hypothetical protein
MEAKKLGDVVELKFQLKAMEHGFTVSKPIGDNDRYDLITDYKSKLNRIQVKSVSYKDTANRADSYRIASSFGASHKKTYTSKDIDALVAYVIPEDVWYIIPVKQISGKQSIRIFPHKKGSGRYEKFINAWDILK